MVGSRELCLDWFWILLSLSEVSWKSHASGTERTGQSALSRGWERLLLFWLVAIGFSKMESFHQLGEFLRMLTNSKSPWKNTIWGICFGTFFPTTSSKSKSMKTDSSWFNLPTPDWPQTSNDHMRSVDSSWTEVNNFGSPFVLKGHGRNLGIFKGVLLLSYPNNQWMILFALHTTAESRE